MLYNVSIIAKYSFQQVFIKISINELWLPVYTIRLVF